MGSPLSARNTAPSAPSAASPPSASAAPTSVSQQITPTTIATTGGPIARQTIVWPIPGIANARFRLVSARERASKLMLFFDEHDALVAATASADDASSQRE